jgi:hypothetical protein
MIDSVFTEYHDRHVGEDILVCGCGDSLSGFQFPRDLVTIGVNDVGRVVDPDYLVVLNSEGQFPQERFQYIRDSRADAIFTQFTNLPVPRGKRVILRLGQCGGTDLSSCDTLPYTRNSPYVAICLAVYMGARRVGLIGVDFSDQSIYGSATRHPLMGQLQRINSEYAGLVSACTARGVELVNLSPTSRISSIPKAESAAWLASRVRNSLTRRNISGLRLVSYATTPVAGVPAILSRCINSRTEHTARCVWARSSYGNGIDFSGDLQWNETPQEAVRLLEEADLLIVHNGFVAADHLKLLATKPIVTMAHNYAWNVDTRWVDRGFPGVVVGQYQATLPEFRKWSVVPNPIPFWEAGFSPSPKADRITVAYTPNGRHERYAKGHRLFWHAKGFETTMRVLQRLAETKGIATATTADRQIPHHQALGLKQRAHIVIDECVTGSYHRNSLEGLAAGAIVVNGVGILPGVVEVFSQCAPDSESPPFVFASLDTLEETLVGLISQGVTHLVDQGRSNRIWLEHHWDFASQWTRFWLPVIERALAIHGPALRTEHRVNPQPPARAPETPVNQPPPPTRAGTVHHAPPMQKQVSVVLPHAGIERLPHLLAVLINLRQRPGIREIIVAEMGEHRVAQAIAGRWADKHVFIDKPGPFERGNVLNAGSAVAASDYLLWHDNDLLIPPNLISQSIDELEARSLDFMLPFSSIRYLSEADSLAVRQGQRNPWDCKPVNTLYSGRHPLNSGALGLVRKSFLERYGGFIDGFLGWGGEDNAWNHKARLLGRSDVTHRSDHIVCHLYHPSSGGNPGEIPALRNPDYSDNEQLLARIGAVRDREEFALKYGQPLSTQGIVWLPRTPEPEHMPPSLTVWTYWEGPCPDWIRACRRTIAKHAPRIRFLTPESFGALWDRDRDINLTGLAAAHKADFVRAFLLHRYGGLWLDCDCLVMNPLEPIMRQLSQFDFIAHRERTGGVSNAFIGAPAGSRIAAEYYTRVCKVLRSRAPLGWQAIGAGPLEEAIKQYPEGWHEIPCALIQPICWSNPAEFFVERDPHGHELVLDQDAQCYMLANVAMSRHLVKHRGANLLSQRTFFAHLLRRSLGPHEDGQTDSLESIFVGHKERYQHLRLESLSGPGSSLQETHELRERMPHLLEDLKVRTLLDAPCGDFNWLGRINFFDLEYIGIDIDSELIAENCVRYGNPRRIFRRLDLLSDVLPKAEAVLCRDLLPHFSYVQIFSALSNLAKSGATYLLTTTFSDSRVNRDTARGEWRTLCLTRAPFDFPTPLRVINEKCSEEGGRYQDKSLAIWTFEALAPSLAAWEARAKSAPVLRCG